MGYNEKGTMGYNEKAKGLGELETDLSGDQILSITVEKIL